MRGLDWPTVMGKEPSLSSKLDFPNVNHRNCFNMFEFLQQSYVCYFFFFQEMLLLKKKILLVLSLKFI